MNNNYSPFYDLASVPFILRLEDANESLGKLRGSVTAEVSLTNMQQSMGGGVGRGGPGGSQNVLLTRFMENATFKALYESKLREVYAQVYVSGALLETIDHYSTLIHTVNAQRKLVDITAYDSAVETLKSFITRRPEYLETLEVMQR